MWRGNVVGCDISMLPWSSRTVLLPYRWNGWVIGRKRIWLILAVGGQVWLLQEMWYWCKCTVWLIDSLVTWPKVKPGGQLDPVGMSWAKMVQAENGQEYGPVVQRNVWRGVWLSNSRGVVSHNYVVHRYCWQDGVGSVAADVVPMIHPNFTSRDIEWMTGLCQRGRRMSDASMWCWLVCQSYK
jgi:hypothetical protein